MNLLIVIGLPRSGTSLVHKKIHEETGRKAIYLRDLGLEIPPKIWDYHKVRYRDEALGVVHEAVNDLAEIHDIEGDYKKWIELHRVSVVKSVELQNLPFYLEAFPEASFLCTVRPAGKILSSTQDYFQVTGLRWPYNPIEGMKEVIRQAKTHPERFDYVETEALAEWKSDREPIKTFTSIDLDHLYDELRGSCRNVTNRSFKETYS